ncbi:MAG: D-alanyl-D-alanine carboxypeptidase [Ruminococcaceae bacterium]|nr:D-alanyl-D-alanine carboxypeptidase [Oscillospiraceae bacterium]
MHKLILKRVLCPILSILTAMSVLSFNAGADNEYIPTYDQWSQAADLAEALSEASRENEAVENIIETVKSEDGKTENSELNLGCHSAILMEPTTGTVLFEKNADEPLPIASVTKVMTMLLIMEAVDSGQLSYSDIITVSENAASMGGSQAYLEVGEQISCKDLLKALAVSSANDAAVALAEHIGGSVESFLVRMNERAAELGMTGREFVNVTGLDDSEVHYLSARDVAVMSAELMKHEGIKEFTTIWQDSIRDGKFGLANTNKLIRFYPGATGLKTGYTSKAKFCLSATAKKNGLELVAVVLRGETSDARFADAKAMLNYGFANYAFYTPSTELPENVKVCGGKLDSVKLTCDRRGILVKKGDIAKITEEANIISQLTAPVDTRQSAGSLIIKLDGKVLEERPILTEHDVERLSFGDILREILKRISI